jgi:uncharacterized protein YbcI
MIPNGCLEGDELLDAVNVAMSALHERYGVYNEVEKTMIELERTAIVQETRSAFQTAMQSKFIAEVERLTGRRVLAFISNHHVGPDLEIELFVLAADR